MPDSDFVFIQADSISFGDHGDTDYVYHSGSPVPNSGKDGFVFESGTSLGGFIFFDGWEDGDYTQDPSWTEYVVEGNGEALVVDRVSPDGGTKCLRVREHTGGGTEFDIGWTNGFTGWDTAWSCEGLFYTYAFDTNEDHQEHDIYLYSEGTQSPPLVLNLGQRDGNSNTVPFQIEGPLIDSIDTTDNMDGWKPDTWYHYRIEHDGSGNYDGYCWEDSEEEPESPNATSTGSSPGTEERFAMISINGGGSEDDYAMDHAYMRFG